LLAQLAGGAALAAPAASQKEKNNKLDTKRFKKTT
jgi:hypothetical protein